MRYGIIGVVYLLGSLGLFGVSLEFRVNPNDQTFALFGMDTGTPVNISGEGFLAWRTDAISGPAGNNLSFSNSVAFTTDVGSPGNSSLGYDLRLRGMGSNSFQIILGVSDPNSQTISGTGVYQSYSAFDTNAIALLDQAVALGSLPLFSGTGFSDLTLTSIPEPRVIGLVLGFLALLIACRRGIIPRP
jgi:hypothetical protein